MYSFLFCTPLLFTKLPQFSPIAKDLSQIFHGPFADHLLQFQSFTPQILSPTFLQDFPVFLTVFTQSCFRSSLSHLSSPFTTNFCQPHLLQFLLGAFTDLEQIFQVPSINPSRHKFLSVPFLWDYSEILPDFSQTTLWSLTDPSQISFLITFPLIFTLFPSKAAGNHLQLSSSLTPPKKIG